MNFPSQAYGELITCLVLIDISENGFLGSLKPEKNL